MRLFSGKSIIARYTLRKNEDPTAIAMGSIFLLLTFYLHAN